jgi:hypothetical protein
MLKQQSIPQNPIWQAVSSKPLTNQTPFFVE